LECVNDSHLKHPQGNLQHKGDACTQQLQSRKGKVAHKARG
jgi:hypothetical protein